MAVVLAALGVVSSSPSALQPIRRTSGELELPRVRAGVLQIPKAHARGRVRVIVALPLPPLAATSRTLAARAAGRRLNVASSSSRAYLARLARAQRVAAAQLRRSIPQARIQRRYRVLLDAFAVELPARKLPQLVRLPFVKRVYPSLRYELKLNRSPGLIGATALSAATGARGEGVKIAIVDDGVDPRNPFLSGEGFSAPEGFPRGDRSLTSPKVIVARGFPPPGYGGTSRLAFVPRESFHGTHVAGIAAGHAGTNTGPGADHPATPGLSGVAPRAWVGNYRVFNRPTPIGNDAFVPEIVAAFEAAVADGMDVINFSGGGPQVDPQMDPLVEAVRNVTNAGVVAVISAGNDRDQFGFGSTGSPANAPEAISVAASSNSHVFGPALRVATPDAPSTLTQIPFESNGQVPAAWAAADQTLVDVGSVVSTSGTAVERRICGSTDPNDPRQTPLPPGSLAGAIALVQRGTCTFISKAARVRAAGAVGMIMIDNRPGEGNPIPLQLAVPSGMISDLDGARLLAYLQSRGGRAPVRATTSPLEIETGRSGIITSFSSGGPSPFTLGLKPDVAAPGGEILSSITPEFAGSPFAVFDGTSMAAPHVSGAAALLVQRHPSWTPAQIKSALMSTAGTAWADTARTVEAPVVLQGAGIVNVAAADDPRLFTSPASLSFGRLDVNRGAASRSLLVNVGDAGNGAGTWTVELQPQRASYGASLDLTPQVALAPGGSGDLVFVARAASDAEQGENYGLIVLRQGSVTRRIPYYFFVARPELEWVDHVRPLQRFQIGTTIGDHSHAELYRFPSAPFGPAPNYSGPPMNEPGHETLYETNISSPVANFGAAVIATDRPALIHPWLLGSKDESDVQGYAGTPVNVNVLTYSFRFDVGAAGAVFPRPKRYFFAVDSGTDRFTDRHFPGRYLLRSWVNDVRPPRVKLLTTRVTAGRPLIAARVIDTGSGVDPVSLVIAYRRALVGAALYDPDTGIALFPLPRAAPTIRRGRTVAIIAASDYQETKNVDQAGARVLPNTAFQAVRIVAVRAPAVSWLAPDSGTCLRKRHGAARLVVAASAPKRITAVRFYDGKRRIATVRRGIVGLYSADWRLRRAKRGVHRLRAVVSTRGGGRASAARRFRVCR